jgi:hypothetical protein
MEYAEAKRIRGKSFGTMLGENEGGLGESLKAAISQKTQAKMTGLKEKFDPMNIAKFMTGGSNWAPALLGKLTGRKQSSIDYFSGVKRRKGTADKLGPIAGGSGSEDFLGILQSIESLLHTTREEDKLKAEEENNFAEEKALEKARRHKELMEALTGKPYKEKVVPTAAKEDDQTSRGSIIDDVLSVFGLKSFGQIALKGLGMLGAFAVGPVGLGLLTAAAAGGLGYFLYKVFTDESGYEDPNSDLSKGLKQAESVGGLAGVKDEMEKRKSLPEYEKTMAEIKDYEKNYNEGEKLNDLQLEGFTKRGGDSLEAVKDYKKERDKTLTKTSTATPETPKMKVNSEPVASAAAVPAETPKSGQQLNVVQNENLDLNVPVSKPDPSTVAVNQSANISKGGKPRGNIPLVRNAEETIQRMIYNNTRVV